MRRRQSFPFPCNSLLREEGHSLIQTITESFLGKGPPFSPGRRKEKAMAEPVILEVFSDYV
jgi:hypothetical protein